MMNETRGTAAVSEAPPFGSSSSTKNDNSFVGTKSYLAFSSVLLIAGGALMVATLQDATSGEIPSPRSNITETPKSAQIERRTTFVTVAEAPVASQQQNQKQTRPDEPLPQLPDRVGAGAGTGAGTGAGAGAAASLATDNGTMVAEARDPVRDPVSDLVSDPGQTAEETNSPDLARQEMRLPQSLAAIAPRRKPDASAPVLGTFTETISQLENAPTREVASDQFAEVHAPIETRSIALKPGSNFVEALKEVGVPRLQRNEAATAFSQEFDIRRLRPEHSIELKVLPSTQSIFDVAAGAEPASSNLVALEFRPVPEERILLVRSDNGSYEAAKVAVPMTTSLDHVAGVIDTSLFVSAMAQGAPSQVVAKLANTFAYDIDFQRDIRQGDAFDVLYEAKIDDRGTSAGVGDILYAELSWLGGSRKKGYYAFERDNGFVDFFDGTGQSAKRLLMKTPIDGARLSSGFGRRRHPVLGYARQHKGLDFAAPRGTPIYAAGDGVVERANRYGSFGNYVRIRHANGYKTVYAHLNGFKKGLRAGKRVRQGDVIGYVGTTGRSTGPHLHYEVHLNGKAVNPRKLKIATGVKLKTGELERFTEQKDRIDALRTATVEANSTTVAQKTEARLAENEEAEAVETPHETPSPTGRSRPLNNAPYTNQGR